MPSYIIKPKPDEDFYVMYSSVVDAPTGWGNRAEVLTFPNVDSDRIARADETGSSLHPPFDKWGTNEIIVREGWAEDAVPEGAYGATVQREDLRELCETATKRGEFRPRKGLRERITWYYPEEDE